MGKPLCIDLFCGLGGWSEGFLAEGYECIGFDVERHDYGTGGYPGQLVLQPWVGRARWHYGSFYLWGDVPALMPSARAINVPGFNFHAYEKGIAGGSFQSAAVAGLKWGDCNGKRFDQRPKGNVAAHREGRKHEAHDPDAVGWFGKYKPGDDPMRNTPSHSKARKAASAQIAKIPLPLSQHIARVFKP